MHHKFRKIALSLIPIFLSVACVSKIHEPLTYRIEDNKVIFEFTADDLRQFGRGNYGDLDEFKNRIKMQLAENDSIDFGSSFGWEFVQIDTNLYQLVKNLTELEGSLKYGQKMMFHDFFNDEVSIRAENRVGFLQYEPEHIYRTDSAYIFYLPEFKNANRVVLSGSFNQWNTLENTMKLTDSGWVSFQKLMPGYYEYKFIVDGNWTEDPNNLNVAKNEHGSLNSVFVVPNYTFYLSEKPNAKTVILTGSFVDWNESLIEMERENGRWVQRLYLPDNLYEYKFIVDGEWMLDPDNSNIITSNGHKNSFIELGDKYSFSLKGYRDADEVFCTGDFINWDEKKLPMQWTGTQWECAYILPKGNYEYKFIVDGEWIIDPENEYKIHNEWDTYNSWLVIGEPHVFKLNGFVHSKSVFVAGSFNNWNEEQCSMVYNKSKGLWEFPAYLTPGKQLYKFIVDGIWMTDPDNAYNEGNREDTYNSVLWIKSK